MGQWSVLGFIGVNDVYLK